jgi:hypothetical protein
VYGPPTVTATEAYDKGVREPLLKLAEKLGVTHIRKLALGGGKLGSVVTRAEAGSRRSTARSTR